ncbi:MmgE/PrpD family protein [Micromonospora sp. NPDC005206]|uniref:MmgE/PrpD family protein n=1 Tax=Micromonospora sp. NPDC005206 TaxID=3157022 RepID=UPI0033A63893
MSTTATSPRPTDNRTETSGLVAAMAAYAHAPLGGLSPQVSELTRRTLVDTVGVAVAARNEAPVRILETTLGALPDGPATVWYSGERTDAATAALLNGTAGHALDFDDVTDVAMGHPSVVLWPAIVAAGQQTGASGQAMLDAYVVGFVVHAAVARAMDVPAHYSTGWHSTATIGILGATAGVARLSGLSDDATRRAIGLAASMAGGSRQNFGTMTKPLHPGLAARDAIFAVRLAGQNFTADTEELDSPLGYFSRFAPGADVAAALTALSGTDAFTESGINVKKYPCCYNTHRTADASLHLRARDHIDPAAISRIHVVLEPLGFEPLIHHRPWTGLQGKFSVEYVIAAAMLDGAVNLASFTDEAVQRPEAQALIEKITYGVAETPPFGPQEWEYAYSALEVETTDGVIHRFRTDVPRGDTRAPLTIEELDAKFADCLAFGGQGWDVATLREELWSVESASRVELAAMCPDAASAATPAER